MAVKKRKRAGRFGKTYASIFTSKKLARLLGRSDGLRAMGVWALGTAYCADQLTDGVIERDVLKGVLHGRPSDAAALVAAGFWAEHGDGWIYVDYDESGITAQEVEDARRDGEISICKRWMKDGKPCRCGTHTEIGDL